MGLTFDEAVREYQLRSSIGPLVQGMKLSPFVNVPQQEYDRVKFLNNLFYETINKLRQEYAPTVEMTKEQRKGLLFDGKGRETPHKNFVFMQEVQKVNEKYINIDTLMSAFVHPETIKIVDE